MRRWEASGERPSGIGLEFLYLDEDARRRYLAYLQKAKPKAYVPLGGVASA